MSQMRSDLHASLRAESNETWAQKLNKQHYTNARDALSMLTISPSSLDVSEDKFLNFQETYVPNVPA
jgi:hypothetical protein